MNKYLNVQLPDETDQRLLDVCFALKLPINTVIAECLDRALADFERQAMEADPEAPDDEILARIATLRLSRIAARVEAAASLSPTSKANIQRTHNLIHAAQS